MAGHFACIGIPASSAEEMNRALGRLLDAAEWSDLPKGGRMGLWRDAGGILVSFHTDRAGSIQCCTPAFEGDQRQRVRPTGILKDPECPYCDLVYVEVLGDGDQMVYPLAMQIVDIGLTRDRTPMKSPVTMKIAAFAEELQVWDSDAAFNAKPSEEPRFASESLIPSGLFGPAPHPHAMLTGHVIIASMKRHEVPFIQMVVRTFGGTYDVVAPIDVLPQPPAAGSVVQGSFWMVGRVVDGLQAGTAPRKKRFGLF